MNTLRPAPSLRNTAGMTLLEVLVSVSILVVIGAALAQTGWLLTRGVQSIDTRHEIYHQGQVAMRKIREDVEMAFLVKAKSNDEKIATGFFGEDEGQQDKLDFTTMAGRRVQMGVVAADQREVGYMLVDLPDPEERQDPRADYPSAAKQLVRREALVLDQDVKKGGEESILAEGVVALNFEYWDPETRDWESSWDTKDSRHNQKLPRAVKIELRFPHPNNPKDSTIDFRTIALLGMKEAMAQ